ncbi:MAG: T9SS type A sorting domain-containing protein [Ignavibacteria bacterium]|nr:T9SS type A sorting domain-containing protein [Ignavibacteria bacterium]
MKNLNSLIKTKRPKDNAEYQAILNNDIEKLHPRKNADAYSGNNMIPQTFELYQNYPNPFNPSTKIAFDLPRDARVKLVIYDILGREVKTLINNKFRSAGKYISEFNGSSLASGVYFARILVNDGKDFIAVKKMVLVK